MRAKATGQPSSKRSSTTAHAGGRRGGRSRRVGQTSGIRSALRGTGHVTASGGNVFADLGFAPEEAENLRIRSDLMIALCRVIADMTQIEAAVLLGVSQPRVSELRRGLIDKFTIDTLVNMLGRAGLRARVSLRKTRRDAA